MDAKGQTNSNHYSQISVSLPTRMSAPAHPEATTYYSCIRPCSSHSSFQDLSERDDVRFFLQVKYLKNSSFSAQSKLKTMSCDVI